jgi:hypothetical protein
MGALDTNYWWVAPVHSQAEIAFRRMRSGLPQSVIVSTHEGSRITLRGNRGIWFKSGDNPDSLYGEDVYAAVIDEASRAKEEAFHAVRSTLTATRGPLRCIGNVKGKKNWFYLNAREAEKGRVNHSYHKLIAADAVAAGVLEENEIEDARRLLPEKVFRELYFAEPSDDEGNPFGGTDVIKRNVRPLSKKNPVAWGWDLGKSVDWTVGIALDEDGATCKFERFQMPWPETLLKIKRETRMTASLVDSTGLGDPIVDILQKDTISTHEGQKFTMQSKQQMMEALAVAIQSSEIYYPDGPIVSELDSFEYEYTRTGVKYSAPEGVHDDCVCALALAHKCRVGEGGLEIWKKLGGG